MLVAYPAVRRRIYPRLGFWRFNSYGKPRFFFYFHPSVIFPLIVYLHTRVTVAFGRSVLVIRTCRPKKNVRKSFYEVYVEPQNAEGLSRGKNSPGVDLVLPIASSVRFCRQIYIKFTTHTNNDNHQCEHTERIVFTLIRT